MNKLKLPTEYDLNTPYAEGSLAYWAGDSLDNNPHKPDTLSHLEWLTGWRDTRRAAHRHYSRIRG